MPTCRDYKTSISESYKNTKVLNGYIYSEYNDSGSLAMLTMSKNNNILFEYPNPKEWYSNY